MPRWKRPRGARAAFRVAAFSALAGLTAALTPAQVRADPDLQSSIVRGGRLYDNWYGEIRDLPPARPRPD